MQIFFFGCWDSVGHYVWTPSMRHASPEQAGPWKASDLDASPRNWRGESTGRGLVPADPNEKQGEWRLTVAIAAATGAAWTAIGCWDRTEDSRHGSKAVFIAEGEHDEAAMRALAARHFFLKQWGGPTPNSGGRLLDGRTHDGMPDHLPGAMPPGRRVQGAATAALARKLPVVPS